MCGLGHDKLPTFGVGKDVSKSLWRSYLRQLVAADVLRIDIGGFGALKLGERGRPVLKSIESVSLHGEAEGLQRECKREAATLPENFEPAMFARLKQLRKEIANDEGVPAFVVFHDRSLVEIAALKPQNLDQLVACHGVGKSKLSRYGERILAALNDVERSRSFEEVAQESEQQGPPKASANVRGYDYKLFRHLKALRLEIAIAENVQPHVVFNKFSLQEMAANHPKTLDELGECFGVDEGKLERYGKRFLTVLQIDEELPEIAEDKGDSKTDLVENFNSALFAELDALRLEIAESENLSPSAVFPDRTLKEMTVLLPQTPDALAECFGVGPRKLERYGGRFLDGIRTATGEGQKAPTEVEQASEQTADVG